jgi:hypothetical protein
MLHKATTLQTYQLDSTDGEMGKVKEFYFDDRYWSVRYLVAETGSWLMGRKVLLSPQALVTAIRKEKHIVVNLSKKQIEESPLLSSEKTVSRQFEDDYHGYFGWTQYGMVGYPLVAPLSSSGGVNPDGGLLVDAATRSKRHEQDPHLQSSESVRGISIEATDGSIGHVENFIIDDDTWLIHYLIVSTKNWWPGKKVLIATKWIESMSWEQGKVFVNLTRESIKKSPEYSDEELLTREYEAGLHTHFQREGYWSKESTLYREHHVSEGKTGT